MHTLTTAWEGALHLARLFWESASYVTVFLCAFFTSRGKLAAEVVALRSQVAACRDRVDRKQVPKPRFTAAFRLLWVVLSRLLTGWEDLAQLVKPATVKRWHNRGYRLWWRWRSRKRGRPSLEQEMRALIRKLSGENLLWSAERIRDTLLRATVAAPLLITALNRRGWS